MIILRYLPVIFSTLLFAAHIMRFHGLIWALLAVLFLTTLFIRKSWIVFAWQILLTLATIQWIIISIRLIHFRLSQGEPYTRLTIILGVVIAFNIFSIFWLKNKKIRSFYKTRDHATAEN